MEINEIISNVILNLYKFLDIFFYINVLFTQILENMDVMNVYKLEKS